MNHGSRLGLIRVGAVAYDPKVVTIWEGFKSYFEERDCILDYVLYSNYDAQVDALLNGEIEVAWNSPLAWIDASLRNEGGCNALVMRDSDRDLTSKILVRKQSGIKDVASLRQKTIAVGAVDSPQATLIPLSFLAESGLVPERDCRILTHNVMVGKHGDHVGGERDAAKALMSGAADAACILDANYTLFINEGTLDPGITEVLATTPLYDHCNFTAKTSLPKTTADRFTGILLAMSFQDSKIRPYMEMEGLRKWLPGRTSGYAQLESAVARTGFFQKAVQHAS